MAQQHIEETIAEFAREVERKDAELRDTQRLVNMLCVKVGRTPLYPDADKKSADAGLGSIARDQWYGQPISTAIREYLTMRKASNRGPATVNEVYDALVGGGYSFDTRDADNAKRGIRICLTKNSLIFHRLPDGSHYGLLDWYPDVKARKEREPALAVERATEKVAADGQLAVPAHELVKPSAKRVRLDEDDDAPKGSLEAHEDGEP